LCSQTNTELGKPKENKGTTIHFKTDQSLFLTAKENLAPSFTKAIYETPDFLEVVKRNGTHLKPKKQVLLLQTLTQNGDVFTGGKEHYTG
jgi:hypothetical protein